jgi:hypothetical protein
LVLVQEQKPQNIKLQKIKQVLQVIITKISMQANQRKITCPDGSVVKVGTKCQKPKEQTASAGVSTSTIVGLSVGIPLAVLFIILIGLMISTKNSIKTAKKVSYFEKNYTLSGQ